MRNFLAFALVTVILNHATGQNIGSYIDLFSRDSLVRTVRELSGEDSVIINGTKTIIRNRAAYLGGNLTEEYLKAKLAGFGLIVQTQKYSINGLNIFGIQTGTKYPEQAFIVSGHHDAVVNFCADDDASGCAAVLETARILSGKKFEYTIIYTFWDEEEVGLWGSTYYAKQLKSNGQIIKGIIVLDMIGYDGNNDHKFDLQVVNDPACLSLADSAVSIISSYNLDLDYQIMNPGSDRGDHYSFWKQGINKAIGIGERIFTDDPNPAYHTIEDRIGLFNIPYFAELSKMTLGLMATLARPSVTGVLENDHGFALELYPNPNRGKFQIIMNNHRGVNVLVTDIAGRIILQKKISESEVSIDLKDIPPGIYLVSISVKNEKFTRKLIVSP